MQGISRMKAVGPLQMSPQWKERITAALPKIQIILQFRFQNLTLEALTTWNKWKIISETR